MLKNKKAIYILIPLNLLIWGFFIYRFYSAYNSSDTPALGTSYQAIKMENIKDSVVYQLDRNYKDPFLKDVRETRSNNSLSSEKKIPKANLPAAATNTLQKNLPEIKYLGLIKNTSSGMSTALISINGQSKLIKQNESFDGIVFKSFNKDSLVARWGKERIVAKK